jgi:hypothetical protein
VRAPQDVLLGWHALDAAQRRLVVPGEMRVRLDHARHQRGAGTIDDRKAGDRHRARSARHALDAVALHQHFAGIGIIPAAVEDAHIGEQHIGHRHLP